MSNYPPVPPYAAYGNQPPTNPPYLPPSFPNQYIQPDDGHSVQAHTASNYNASAYGYNNSIPGFSAGSLAPAAPPLPIYQGWNQDALPLPSYSTPQNNVQYTGYGGNSYQAQQPYAPPQPHNYHQNTRQVAPYDEGELSEGEFDTYGGQGTGGVASADYGSNYYQSHDGTGYTNTAHRAVYPNGQEYSNQHHASGNDYNNYQRESDSYSPYAASPLEVGQDERWKGKQKQNNIGYASGTVPERPANDTSWMQKTTPHTSHTFASETVIVPAPLRPAGILPLPAQQVIPVQHDSTNQSGQTSTMIAPIVRPNSTIENPKLAAEERSTTSGPLVAQKTPTVRTGFPKSVAEARKKAEGAIINLWPYEVRFPNYVEEGMDEGIIGRLFDELGLSRAMKAAVADTKSSIEILNRTGPKKSSPESVQVVEQSGLGVADQARRAHVENSGNRVSNSAATSAPPAKTEPTEKEKNLKMKMEALRKSRQERAEKAAAKTFIHPSTAITTGPQPEATIFPIAGAANSPAASPLSVVQPTTDAQPPANVLPSLSSIAQPIPPPQPVIPGLFLASKSSPVPPPAPSNTALEVPSSNQRKRPVAADWDMPASAIASKRPFGQSRSDSLVIDVSEEEPDSEDEDVAMDLDSQADQETPLQPTRKISDQRTVTLQDFPPLTNFPARRAFLTPPGPSAASTPAVATVAKSTLGHPQVLQQKEIEIEEMKKMIAAKEAAKAAKRRAQQTLSGVATPQLQQVNGTNTNGNGDIASKVEASLQMQQLIDIAQDKISSDQKRLADTQAAEQEKAAELKRNEAESRRLRREKIATDLPRVDAEVEQSQFKLQKLREEMARVEAAVKRSMDDKRKLAEEMEKLGQEAEDQLQEQKDKLKVLSSAEGASFSNCPDPVSLSIAETNAKQVRQSYGPHLSKPDSASTKSISPPPMSGQESTQLADSSAGETTQTTYNDAILANFTDLRKLYIGNVPYATTEADLQSLFKGYLIESTSIPKNPRTERPIGYAFVDLSTPSEAERAIFELSGKKILDRIVSVQLARNPKHHVENVDAGNGGEASSGAQGGRHSSTNVVLHSSSSTSDQTLEVALQEHIRAEAESHELSEEDKDMEDSYAPDPAQLAPNSGSNSIIDDTSAVPGTQAHVHDGDALASQLPNGQQNSTMDMDIVEDDENDDYEPPEPTPQATPPVDMPSPVEFLSSHPALPESVTDFEQFSFGRGDFENTAGKKEELQVNGHVPSEEPVDTINQVQSFTPYESPLKRFRAFRFHPDYKQYVSGGLKSMTYSHKINPNTEFCRYELAGGVCNDKKCEFQHFKDIALPDDTILSTLGTPEEFPADQQQKFREGLRQILTDLHLRKVQDFDTIAAEVLAHRTRFLGDPSKVLMLEGTTI